MFSCQYPFVPEATAPEPVNHMNQMKSATLLHRIGKWMLPGDETPPAHLGGKALGDILEEVPFKVVLTCTWTNIYIITL